MQDWSWNAVQQKRKGAKQLEETDHDEDEANRFGWAQQ